jgi:hypothetical protein
VHALLSAECEHASVRVHAASLLAIGSKQKFAALRARYSIVADAATAATQLLQLAAGPKQKQGEPPITVARCPLVRETRSDRSFDEGPATVRNENVLTSLDPRREDANRSRLCRQNVTVRSATGDGKPHRHLDSGAVIVVPGSSDALTAVWSIRQREVPHEVPDVGLP